MKGSQTLRSKRDKTKDEIEFEKAQNQCTFKPQIIKTPGLKSSKSASKLVSNFIRTNSNLKKKSPMNKDGSENVPIQSRIITNLLKEHYKNHFVTNE